MKIYGKKLGNKKGFTLIELLIVIAILAILALLGLPRLAQFRQDAQVSEIRSTGAVIGRAAEAWIAANPNGTFSEAGLVNYLNGATYTRASGSEFTVSVSGGDVTVTYGGTVTGITNPVYTSSTSGT